ncbi:Cation transporter [Syntrophomonas zehnderi OL-4]|uniref:Cation transporter n=1 Tax=Syntrophomonas zehnderi OL-4 TaxID=690567 RepID=A0A0E3W2G9_9FIRM|nr:TrkH family potassium uptake protein [Syntrophomonas zehnderi]CFW99596.1 Cation transporter [Syntrophomonas zehnderi OL-4]
MIRLRVLLSNLGRMTVIIGISMLTCLIWTLSYRENITGGIILSAGITIAVGLILVYAFKNQDSLNYKEGFAVVTLGWLLASIFGALPYMLTGYLPTFADAWFESMSGFTTTGASVITDVEALPKGLLFWRSLTQWLGGIGIIALFVAIISNIGVRANQLFKAEVPGPVSDKISPRIRETAKTLWKTYAVLSLACLLTLWALGMNFFDALCHTFTTLSTGGFSTKNSSIAFYSSPFIQWAIIIFMFIGGTNFGLHYITYKKRRLTTYTKDSEFRLYTAIVVVATLLIAINLGDDGGFLKGFEESIRIGCFQVVSIVTSTGFATTDYNLWPSQAGIILLLMMFVGGCAGSTGGGIKPGRYLIIMQRTVIELRKMIHPQAIMPQRFRGRVLNDNLIINVFQFFFLYILVVVVGTVVMCWLGMDFLSGLTASVTCMGNIGPGFGQVGPTSNFAMVPALGKYVLSFEMLIGRLEIYPLLVMLLPTFWHE